MRRFVSVVIGCMVAGTGAFAQTGDILVSDRDGATLSLSPESLYGALGDRLVSGDDAIGNSRSNWNQVDASLPYGPIGVSLPAEVTDATLVTLIRLGCEGATGNLRACEKVGLRRDRIVRQGGIFDDSAAHARVALLDQKRADLQADMLREAQMKREAAAPAAMPPEPAATPLPVPVPTPPEPTPVAKPETPVVAAVSTPRGDGAITETPLAAPVMEDQQDRVYASRMYIGQANAAPESFAAYGVLAFSTLATSADGEAYLAICEAFFSTLIDSDDLAAEVGDRMITAWPIDDRRNPGLTDSLNSTRAARESCSRAVEFYDIQRARGSIDDAGDTGLSLTGRGPFLLAWAPAGAKAKADAVVLAADLSDVKTVAEATRVLTIWRDEIERDAAFWQDGFSPEKIRTKLGQINDGEGDSPLRFIER